MIQGRTTSQILINPEITMEPKVTVDCALTQPSPALLSVDNVIDP